MTSSRHTAEQVQAFIGDGETRFVAAAFRDPDKAGDLFVMPDGDAGTLRTFTREQLRCLIADCPEPDVVAVSRNRRRDGFRHRAGGGGHAPESVNHLQGKAVLAQWLRTHLPDGQVQVEGATDTQRTRVADVLAILDDGHRIAFEVQYAPLSVQEWRERHASYAAQGITDVWLWGHTRLHRSRSPYDPPVRLNDVQDEVRRAGLPVLWINPETSEIARAVTRLQGDRLRSIDDQHGEVVIQSLRALGLSPAGFTSPLLEAIADLTIRLIREKDRQRLEAQRREAERAATLKRRQEEWITRRSLAAAPEGHQQTATSRFPDGTRPCHVCGKPVATLIATGIHIGCEPGFWRGVRTAR